jgi:SAM-dependent methyltransferase
MNPITDGQSERLRLYFEQYPERGGKATSRLARQGEKERLEVVRSWMPDCRSLSLLDVGCGDGEFLYRLLTTRPTLLRIEDIVGKWVDVARNKLEQSADTVASVVVDSKRVNDPVKYDIVMAFGVFDYEPDWRDLLGSLMARSRGLVLVDFPKRGIWRNRIRNIWLRWHGLRLHTTGRAELESLLQKSGAVAEIRELPLQYVIKLTTLAVDTKRSNHAR